MIRIIWPITLLALIVISLWMGYHNGWTSHVSEGNRFPKRVGYAGRYGQMPYPTGQIPFGPKYDVENPQIKAVPLSRHYRSYEPPYYFGGLRHCHYHAPSITMG